MPATSRTPGDLPLDPPPLGVGGDGAPAPGSDVDRLAHEPSTTCLNCGAVLPGRYCPDCGQKDQPIRQPAHVFIAESVSEYFGLDGRLWRSLGLLLVKPGALTEAYLEGRRTRYLRPLRLYLTASLLFFFLLSLLDPFAIDQQTVVLRPVPPDTTLRAVTLADRLNDRAAAAETEREAVLSAAALVNGIARGDSLRALADRVGAFQRDLAAWESNMDDLADDSLVSVASLPAPVVRALADTGRVEIAEFGNQIVGGIGDEVPDWVKGDLARQLEETESPTERRLLMAQFQRAVLRQVPTALFLVLPLFAVLLKLFYLRGAGRTPRLQRRPAPVAAGASWWGRVGHALTMARWHVRRWRAQRRARVRRRKLRKARQRPIRGAYRRARMWAREHPTLRPWRVRRIRLLRASLRACRRPYYAEHLVFALHVHAYTFAVLAVLVVSGLNETDLGGLKGTLGAILGASIPVYYLLAQKRVYCEPWPTTIAKASVIGFAYTMLVAGGTLVAAGLALRLG